MKNKSSITALLHQAGGPEMPILPLLLDLARNISNLSRIGGPKFVVVPPADGRALQTSLIDFLNFFANTRLSNLEDRQKLRSEGRYVAKRGQRFDVDAWLRSTVILMKMAQTEAIAKRKMQLSIVSRYLERPGRWEDPQGIGEDQIHAWRKKDLLRKHLFGTELVMRTTALAVPANLDDMSTSEQLNYMRGLGERAKELFEPLTDNLFPAEALWLLFDFSLHKDAELRDFLVALKPYREESLQDRLQGFIKNLAPALIEIEDLLPEKPTAVKASAPVPAFLLAIENGAPAWFFQPHNASLLKLILPVEGAIDEKSKAIDFDSRFDDACEQEDAAAWLPLYLR